MYYIKYTFVNTFFRFFRITFLLYKKNIDRLNRGEPTFFLEPNEVKEVKKRCKKDEFNIFKPYQPPCTESTGFDVRTGTPSMLKHTIVIIYKYIFYSILLIFNIFFYSLSSYLPYTPTKISCRPHMLSPKLLP